MTELALPEVWPRVTDPHAPTPTSPLPQGEVIKKCVFLVSFWGEQLGHKVKKICDW